jgi:hypothetical protein
VYTSPNSSTPSAVEPGASSYKTHEHSKLIDCVNAAAECGHGSNEAHADPQPMIYPSVTKVTDTFEETHSFLSTPEKDTGPKAHLLSPLDESFISLLEDQDIGILESTLDSYDVEPTLETIYEEQDNDPPNSRTTDAESYDSYISSKLSTEFSFEPSSQHHELEESYGVKAFPSVCSSMISHVVRDAVQARENIRGKSYVQVLPPLMRLYTFHMPVPNSNLCLDVHGLEASLMHSSCDEVD